ncbi:MAG: hypothetical protein J6V20_01490 [Bacteroidaceae bacterium]|nr:hypothetical protein [Bacteroidaceae bacterium]
MNEQSNDFGIGYAVGRDTNCGYGGGYGNGMFGGDWAWWIIILLIFGWGGNGYGFGGGFGGFGGGHCASPCATQADVRAAVDQQTLISKLDQQTYGLADSTYALNNTITAGFHGVDNALCSLGYNTQAGFNGISRQIAECCCDTRAAIADVKYANERNTCDIIRAGQDNTRAILDFLTQDKISTLTAENQALKFQASQTAQNAFITANQQAQTAELIRRLGADCPQPAYVVQPPQPVTFATNCSGQATFGFNNGCGCGCN